MQILGSNSALAAHGRHPTAQVVQYDRSLFLIDCGEGSQMRMSTFHVKRSKIKHIFISHLHGDHYFGLIGLLTSYHLQQRKEPLIIFAPEPLENIINTQLQASNTKLKYEITYVITKDDKKRLILENDNLNVFTFPLKHRIPTTGFLFEEKVGLRRVDGNKTDRLRLSRSHYNALKNGEDISVENKVYKNESLTLDPYKSRSYAFCSDTIFNPNLSEFIPNVNLLYHEATFTKEAVQRAAETHHSTTEQAAEIAQTINADELLIGHFSSKYKDLEIVLEEAKAVFPNTKLAIEGESFEILR